ncbi:ATP-binding protein [Ramlibacter sp. AN1015]|uniref:sensor histidine kinase n=1 Tax=Ramlibacter sp. AN1015 TaxID=3133428 RepID=UPI0030C15524
MHDALSPSELADALPEPLLLVSSRGTLLSANRAAAALLGVPAQSLANRRLAELVLESEEAVQELLTSCSRSRSMLPSSLTFVGPAGEPLACTCQGAVARPRSASGDAQVLLRVAVKASATDRFLLLKERIEQLSREISRRRMAEAALLEAKEWYRVTLESIGDAVVVTDREGRVTFMNAVAQELTGWPLQDAERRHLDEVFVIVNDETRASVESPVSKVLRLGGIVGLANHTLLIRRDGSELPIDDSGAPIRSADGTLGGVVLVFRDLSERYRLERELVHKTRRLEETDRRKDEFLSMLAHELRNPLAPLRNGVHLLSTRYAQVQGVGRLAGMMGRQIEHMVRLVDDLLDVARLTRGAIRLQTEHMRLADAIEQAAEMSRPHMDSRGLRFTVALPPPTVWVDGDRTRLVQVVSNLLSNAAKFTPPGGSVQLGYMSEGGQAVVSVIDTGAGIEAELLPRIFELFVQGDATLERSSGGLGIGLTIAQSIAHMHGGDIEASSRGPGQGSEFVLRLPLLEA